MSFLRSKYLEIILERIPSFRNPKLHLEQYITPTPIAAKILWLAFLRGDIEGKIVLDLGCGTGRLAIGSALLGAKEVICIDIDPEALSIARRSYEELCSEFALSPIMFVVMDLRKNPSLYPRSMECTVIMNPPFGVQSRGADIEFLKCSMRLCRTIYSIHKFSEGFLKILNDLCRGYGFTYEIINRINFPIRWFLPKHRRKVYYVDSLIIRLRRP